MTGLPVCCAGEGYPGIAHDLLVARRERDEAQERLRDVVSQFNMWSEDANDGEFAYWRSDGLMVACVKARSYLAGVGS